MEQVQAAPQRNPLRGLIKLLLKIIVWPIVLVFIAIRRYTLLAFIALIALAGGLMWLSSNPVSLPLLSNSVSGSAPSTTGSPRVAIESYLTGQERFDAKMMWEAMGEDYRQVNTQRGRTLESFQQVVDQLKQSGLTFNGFQYVGGATLKDGSSVHLYLVTRNVPARQGPARLEQVPYTFTVDKAGKIANIE